MDSETELLSVDLMRQHLGGEGGEEGGGAVHHAGNDE